jgi:hypothetical protein
MKITYKHIVEQNLDRMKARQKDLRRLRRIQDKQIDDA